VTANSRIGAIEICFSCSTDSCVSASNARIVLTDSGGLQEESTALGIPCLTLRANTERPATVVEGTNRIVGTRTDAILAAYRDAIDGRIEARRPPLWDGQTAGRAAAVLQAFLTR